MVFASPMPDEAAWRSYNENYFDNAHGGASGTPISEAFFSAMGRLRCAYIESFLLESKLTPQHVLEIGPGRGHFAKSFLVRFPQVRYSAIESDLSCHGVLGGLGVRVVSLDSNELQGGHFDLIVMSHVLEHVIGAFDFLQAASARLSSRGLLFIEVPCRDFEYKTLDEPHLLFFDKRSLRRLLERVGFDNIRLSYHGQRIEELAQERYLARVASRIRNRMMSLGLTSLFASRELGLEAIDSSIERAVVKPYLAHVEQSSQSRWLRAVATRC